jgi:hypothetical protein
VSLGVYMMERKVMEVYDVATFACAYYTQYAVTTRCLMLDLMFHTTVLTADP